MAINYPQRYDDDFLNTIKTVIDHVNAHGKTIQDLVAEGQLTEEQYAELITVINGHLKSGDVGKSDLTLELRSEVDGIQNKIDKGDVTVQDIDKNKGKFDQTYLTEELLQQIAGTASINAVPENKSITGLKIARNAVSPEELSFTKKPDNILHFNNALRGYTFDHATGKPIENANFVLSDYIPILPNSNYVSKDIGTMYLFDESMQYITRRTNSPHSTEDDTVFARFSVPIQNVTSAQVNAGTELKPYDASVYKIGGEKSRLLISPTPKSIQRGAFEEGATTPLDTSFFARSNNLFNKYNLTDGKGVDVNGNIIDDATLVLTDYETAKPETVYSKTKSHALVVAEYSGSKEFLRYSNLGNTVDNFTTGKSTEYVRYSTNKAYAETIMINEGETLLDYEDYKFVLRSSDEHPISIDKSLMTEVPESSHPSTNYEFDRYDINPAFMTLYSAPIMDDKSSDSAMPLINMTADEIYALYDGLMDQYPDYISKELLGHDATGLPIYKYEFIPDIPRKNATDEPMATKFIKFGITAGVHGVERQAVWTNYNMFYQMCNNWQSDALIEALRWEVHFVVIPVANPWSFNNNQRKNSNGVDINRNFYPNWVLSDPSSETYGGTEPLSELESQYIYNVMESNKDATFFIDFHNFFSSAYDTPKNFIYTYSHNKYGLTKSKGLISRVSRKWRKEHDFLLNSNELYGYAALMRGASVSAQSFDLGLNGMTFEQSRFFELEPNYKQFNSISNTLGLEAYVNFLASLIRDSNIVSP